MPGFGQMRTTCFVCGAQARYSPGGPPPGAKVVDPPNNAAPSSRPSVVVPTQVSAGTFEPTLPVQASEALLAMDAQEGAPTAMSAGLTPDMVPGSSDDYQPTMPATGLNAAALGLTEEEENASTEAMMSPFVTGEGMPGLQQYSAEEDEQPDTEMFMSDMVRAKQDVEEDAIPTRALAGLADRDITGYAPELYGGEVPKPEAVPPRRQHTAKVDQLPPATPGTGLEGPSSGPYSMSGSAHDLDYRSGPQNARASTPADSRARNWAVQAHL